MPAVVTEFIDTTLYPLARHTLNPILHVIGDHIAEFRRNL